MPFSTIASKLRPWGTGCKRARCVFFLLLLWSKDENFGSYVRADFTACSASPLAASHVRQMPLRADPEICNTCTSAEENTHLNIENPRHASSLRKVFASELSFAKQLSAAAVGPSPGARRNNSHPLSRALGGLPLKSSNEVLPKFGQAVVRRKKQFSLPSLAGGSLFPVGARLSSVPRTDALTHLVELQTLQAPPTFSEQQIKSSFAPAPPTHIPFCTFPPGAVLQQYAPASPSAGAPPTTKQGTSSVPARVPVLNHATLFKSTLSSSAPENYEFLDIGATPACTGNSGTATFSSFLHASTSSQAVMSCSSGAVPHACKFAGCKAGTFRGRDISDRQDCFALAHCSRCPLYPIKRLEFCSKLTEIRNHLLLMQSTLQLMPEPALPFHYRPGGVETTTMREGDEGQGAGGAAEDASFDDTPESGGVPASAKGWYDDGGNDQEGVSVLQVESYTAVQERHPRLENTSTVIHKKVVSIAEKNGSTAYSTTEVKKPTELQSFSNSALLEFAGPVLGASEDIGSEYSYFKDGGANPEDPTVEAEAEEPENIPSKAEQSTEMPGAELLKFDQSRIFRVQLAEMRAQLSGCAVNAKGMIRLLVMFAFQPTRPKMSVQELRQRLGLFTSGTAPPFANGLESAEQPFEAEVDEESMLGGGAEKEYALTTENQSHIAAGGPHFTYVQQSSSSDVSEGTVGMHAYSISPRIIPQPSSRTKGTGPSADSISPYGESERRSRIKDSSAKGSGASADGKYSRFASPVDSHSQKGKVSPASPLTSVAMLQTDDFAGQDNSWENNWQSGERGSSRPRNWLGRVKSAFRRRRKNEDYEEPLPADEADDEEEELEDEPRAGTKLGKRGRVRHSRVKRFFGKLFRRKSPQEKQELKEKKRATKVLVHAPRIHLEIAVISPAVRHCRKTLEWTGRLRLSTMLHVQHFLTVRKAEVEDQVAAFINNALQVVIRCGSKRGCVINKQLQSCVLVSCAKHKDVSREVTAASSKNAEALARSQLRMAQRGTGGILSQEERFRRAAAFAHNVKQKQHALEAQQLQERQQTLSEDDWIRLVQRQVDAFSAAKPDATQQRLLEAIGPVGSERRSRDFAATPPVIQEATQSVVGPSKIRVSEPSCKQGDKRRFTGAFIALTTTSSVAGVLAIGALVYWWYRRRQVAAERFLFHSSILQ